MLELKLNKVGFHVLLNNHKLLTHSPYSPLMVIGKGNGTYKLSHGMFKIKEKISEKTNLTRFRIVKQSKRKVIIELLPKDEGRDLSVTVEFKQVKEMLEVFVKPNKESFNRFWLKINADETEAVYGCGEQFSELNLRGHKVPLFCQEQGVGRGDPPIFTFLCNMLKGGAGGNRFTTYYPQPTFVSSWDYFFHAEITAYSEFNFKDKRKHLFYCWEIPEKLVFGKGMNQLETVGQLTNYLGKQPPLPEWTMDGIILGIQGGTEVVKTKLAKCKEHGIKVAAVWCQDWEGRRITSFGKQLFWDWKYDEKLYPDLPKFIKELHSQGIKFLGYINTFLALEGELYKEASKKGLLVKNKEGEEYHVVITTFPAAILDLTNPKTVKWIKNVIKKNMLGIGLDGWMADFGEYLPTDAVLHSGEDAALYHNKFPVEWARINREVLKETKKMKDAFFFTRAGYSKTSRYSTLVWAGDQLVSWSMDDGLASVIPAGISLGFCGIGNYHYDIGGYTSLFRFKRTREVFMRWAEAAAFSMMMRTHEGNRPDTNWQFDSDEETLDHLAKMVDVYHKLKPYIQHIGKEYQEKGIPPMRSCSMHYNSDPIVHKLKYQYLLGDDLLVAPVVKAGKTSWKVYLPENNWVHLWTGKEFLGGAWVEVAAPLGEPPVFYNTKTQFRELFASLRQ